MFTKAIVKKPGRSITKGITTANLGIPNYENALLQHESYINALKSCGVEVIILEAEENYPDSCFVEDTALITPRCCIVTNPGAKSRKGEINVIEETLNKIYTELAYINNPGTLEAGDIMKVGNIFYIGLSNRTNAMGGKQLISILNKNGYEGILVEMKEMLHLKTGLSYIEHNNLLITGEFVDDPLFDSFHKVIVDPDEAYAANCIWVNDKVIVPAGHPKTRQKINNLGYSIIEVNVSEFQKLDGGLSCLSLRF